MRRAAELSSGEVVEAEVAIIGTGAGGCMALAELAQAGVDVVALELGERHPTETMTRREEQMLPRLFLDGGARATQDMAIRVLQGKGVGGSTLHNTNLCKRLHPDLLAAWGRDHGLEELARGALDDDFAAVERELSVHPVPPERMNANNRLIARGVAALGWRGAALSHNRQGCEQSGFCELGCPNNGKQNGAKILVPRALAHGGRVLTGARVERIAWSGRRAESLVVSALDERGAPAHTFEVRARSVVLAASATNSAALAERSRLPDPHKLCGTNLHLHPGAFVVGRFDHEVRCWQGVPQSYESTEFLGFGDDAERGRAWLVGGAAHPGAAAGLLPGFGAVHGALMRDYAKAAAMIVMLHDHSAGRVYAGDEGTVRIHYRSDAGDRAALADGLRAAARVLLAAGAREVVVPLSPAIRARSEGDLDAIRPDQIGPFSPPLVAVHPMSTMWMGRDPRRSVVDERGRHHGLENLYVADGSLFPTSIGGPPQVPIYALARRVARAVVEDLRA